ncbi:MAG TPA: AraC family transcriptional regulator [Acidobacteriaceae bacterium]|nr:AraC family transcriptional regulator [Acidobacteriaceae bacterium]
MSSINVGRLDPLPPLAPFRIGETFIPASAVPLPPHRHRSAQIHFIVEGTYAETSRGKTYELGPGSALFRPAGELHSNCFAGAVHGLLIDLTPAVACRLMPRLNLSEPSWFPAPAFDDLVRSFFYVERENPSERHTLLQALALTLAARISRHARGGGASIPDWIESVVAIIRNRYAEDLRLTGLADEIGVPPRRLAAVFRRCLSKPVGEFLLEVRLHHAHAAVLEGQASLPEIAVSCGFYDQAHMTRAFRRLYGLPPGQLRRRSRSNVQILAGTYKTSRCR